jgi:hypothetical protein
MNESLSQIARREGTNCVLGGAMDVVGCVRDALVMETEMAVSAACATCYGVSVACSADNCAGPCLTGTPEECLACQCGGNDMSCNCIEQFTLCSGLPSTMCD